MNAPITAVGDIEARLGIPTLESLLAERDALVKQVALLRAMHGPFGTYEALRKIQLDTIAAGLRAQAVAEGRKVTEASIVEAAHADERYVAWITQATQEKAEWAVAENTIQGIADTIQRGHVIARYLAQEIGLTR